MPIERGSAAASRRIDAMQRRRLTAALALAAALAPLAPACAQVVEPRIHAPGPFDTLVVTGAGQVHLFQGERDEIVIPGERASTSRKLMPRCGLAEPSVRTRQNSQSA